MAIKDPKDSEFIQEQCANLEKCLDDVNSWMTANKLKLNGEKTEILVLGSDRRIKQAGVDSISVAGKSVAVSKGPIKNLGAKFDPKLDMAAQATQTLQNARIQLRKIGKVRHQLTQDATRQLVQSLVISRLDYCNSLLYGLSSTLMEKLQVLQNDAARLITRSKRSTHVTPILKNLHWLKIEQRIHFKILCHVYKSLNNLGPKYLADLVVPYEHHGPIRAAYKDLLTVPEVTLKTVGSRSFRVGAAKLWNSIPVFIRRSNSLSCFKTSLKTHYFKRLYD